MVTLVWGGGEGVLGEGSPPPPGEPWGGDCKGEGITRGGVRYTYRRNSVFALQWGHVQSNTHLFSRCTFLSSVLRPMGCGRNPEGHPPMQPQVVHD